MPVLGEGEKAKLQRIFEWSNRGIGIPDPNRWRDNDVTTNEEVQQLKKQLGRGAIRKQKRWLDILANEVVERETVLKVMRAEGQRHLSKDKLRQEIQERIQRMKEIQNNIARHERMEKQTLMAELVDPTKCCQATYNVHREKNKTEGSLGLSLSSSSKRLLEHNLNSGSEKVHPNHRRYRRSQCTPDLPSLLVNKLVGQDLHHQQKEEHHHRHKENQHHHHKENQHHQHKERHRHHHDVEKGKEGGSKTNRHHRTSDSRMKTKAASRSSLP